MAEQEELIDFTPNHTERFIRLCQRRDSSAKLLYALYAYAAECGNFNDLAPLIGRLELDIRTYRHHIDVLIMNHPELSHVNP